MPNNLGVLRSRFFLVLSVFLTACGGGGSSPDASIASAPKAGASAAAYELGGTVAGLDANLELQLLDNGDDSLEVTENGSFQFAQAASSYAVSVRSQPLWQWCSVTNGSGIARANTNSVAVFCSDAVAEVSTFAGSGVAGSADGTGASAAFNAPQGAATDSAGNVYIADTENNKIRKITPDGIVTTLAGSGVWGSADGSGRAASFNLPMAVTVDLVGNVYVADAGNNEIRKIASDGTVTTLAGSGAMGSTDGAGSAASFNFPYGVAVDAAGNVYVADSGNNEIRRVSPAGVVTTVAGTTIGASNDGTGAGASFQTPVSVALSPSGDVYVVDAGGNKIRKVTPMGAVETLPASFDSPNGVAVDFAGYIYVSDSANNQVRRIAPAGTMVTLVGATNGTGSATLNSPGSLAVDAAGNVYVADVKNNKIRKLTPVAPFEQP